jgi:hypothetical protein
LFRFAEGLWPHPSAKPTQGVWGVPPENSTKVFKQSQLIYNSDLSIQMTSSMADITHNGEDCIIDSAKPSKNYMADENTTTVCADNLNLFANTSYVVFPLNPSLL